MFRVTKTWHLIWEGQQIKVQSWVNLLAQTGEELFINGKMVHQKRGWAIKPIQLSGEIPAESAFAGPFYRKVQASIGNINGGLAVGCHIFVDGALVGGDIDKKYSSPVGRHNVTIDS